MAKTGFNNFTIDTDIYQDRRIKRLKKKCGCVGLCVYQYILCEVYRVHGYMLEWNEDTIFDISECFGIEETKVSEVVEYMAEIGLFDSAKLAQGFITSASIQRRYYEMSEKAKRKGATIPSEYVLHTPDIAQNTIPEDSAKIPETSGKNRENSGKFEKIPEETPKIPENSGKFEKNSEEMGKIPELEPQSTKKEEKKEKDQKKENKEKINKFSLSVSLPPPAAENGDLTAAERERIFEILFFDRNVKNLNAEAQALIGYYTANGWRRSGGITLKNRVEVARTWKPADPAPRISAKILLWLRAVHLEAKKNSAEDAAQIIHGFVSEVLAFKDGRETYTITTTPAAHDVLRKYLHQVPRPNFSLTMRKNG